MFKVKNKSITFIVNFEYIWLVAWLFFCFCFFFFLLTVNMQTANRILYYLNRSFSMHFRGSSRICVTKVNKSFQPLSIFCLKKFHLRFCIGLVFNILTWSAKVLKHIRGKLYDLEKIWKTHPPRCPKNTFPEVFRIECFVFNIKWTNHS